LLLPARSSSARPLLLLLMRSGAEASAGGPLSRACARSAATCCA
jgi:hypothetical protein